MNLFQGGSSSLNSRKSEQDLKNWRITVDARELHGLKDRSGSRESLVRASSHSDTSSQRRATSRHRDVFSIFSEGGLSLDVDDLSINSATSPSFADSTTIVNSSSNPTATHSNEFTDSEPVSDEGSQNLFRTKTYKRRNSSVKKIPSGKSIGNFDLFYDVYTTKGTRPKNEDHHVISSDSNMLMRCASNGSDIKSDSLEDENSDEMAFFAVYDGHGGDEVAKYLKEHLHVEVFNQIKLGMKDISDSVYPDVSFKAMIRESCHLSCKIVDEKIFMKEFPSGSTAIFMVLYGSKYLTFASVGDSQAVVCSKGVAKNMCKIHKPSNESERKRIESANGKVVDGRIFGVLGVSRAFGDNDLKTSKGDFSSKFNGDLVICEPDVVSYEVSEDDEFVLIACDGIFDVLSPEKAIRFISLKLKEQRELQTICRDLASHALSLARCTTTKIDAQPREEK